MLLAILVVMSGSIQAVECGDLNGSGTVDIGDLVYFVTYIFQLGPPPLFPPVADLDGDGNTDISDLVYLVSWMFQGGPPPACQIQPVDGHSDSQSGCLGSHGANIASPDKGIMQVQVSGDTLTIWHLGATYQCCLMYAVEYCLVGNTIWAFESDSGELCDCICPFDLQSTSWGYAPGTYEVTLIGIYGNVIGTAEVVFPGAEVIYTWASDCLVQKAPADDPQIEYVWSNGILNFFHHNAEFNCSFTFGFSVEQVGDTLRLFERNVTTEDPVFCICTYGLQATIGGLSPGTYVAEVYRRDITEESDQLVDRRPLVLE
jgi:hypothetical protein